MGRSIYCCTCKKEKEPSCLNESRCKSCKSYFAKLRRQKKKVEAGKPENRPEREAKCDACIDKKKQGLSISGRCNKCVVICNNERRHAQRKEEGLPDIPVRDSSFCHICNIPKINGRCVPCRQRMAKERKAKKREEQGKRPWGSGKSPICRCGKEKERPSYSLCDACTSQYSKDRWKNILSKKIQIPDKIKLCACGNESTTYRKGYCKECLATKARDDRALLASASGLVKRKKMTPEEKKLRRDSRALCNSAIRRGLLIRRPCEVCGTERLIEAHHDDYTKALDVRWLCKDHHAEHHRNELIKD